MSSTIAAISTAPGVGGIGIVRLSGKDAFKVLSKIFKPYKEFNYNTVKGYTMKYGYIIESDEIVDEVLVSFFRGPKSYTAENMCEINSHGGIVVLNKILDLCIKNGASIAEAGEFTKRAFLNGRIDLSQAEAVIDIINAKTEKEARISIDQLEGSLSQKIAQIRKIVISMMADIEATIDYPEYDLEEVTNKKILSTLDEVDVILKELETSFDNGKILREGVNTAIIGRPNAGKSSLLNLLLNEERAIVTDVEGTTRDTIEEFISVEGIPLKIIDTAGIRNARDEVEKIGVKKAIEIAKKSDIIIAIFDSSKALTEEDKEILKLVKDKNSIILLNKIDLKKVLDKKDFKEYDKPIIEVSTKTGEGLQNIYKEISKMYKLNEIASGGETIVTNVRHKNLIINARKSLEMARNTINSNMPIDIISTNLKEILEELGKITGETVTDDVISEIFSKFCLGK